MNEKFSKLFIVKYWTLFDSLNDEDKRRFYLKYLNDYLAEPHPEEIDDLNFELSHYKAFNSLVHPDFRDKTIINKYKSLIKGVKKPPLFHWHPL